MGQKSSFVEFRICILKIKLESSENGIVAIKLNQKVKSLPCWYPISIGLELENTFHPKQAFSQRYSVQKLTKMTFARQTEPRFVVSDLDSVEIDVNIAQKKKA